MVSDGESFNYLFLSHWKSFVTKLETDAQPVLIDGYNLDLASVVVIARYGGRGELDTKAMQNVIRSEEVLRGNLSQGQVLYGVNTGFGGSADVRTKAIQELQKGLIRGLNYGVLLDKAATRSRNSPGTTKDLASLLGQKAVPLDDPVTSTCLPETWVRALMLVRLNSLASGASGVRPVLIETLLQLLNKDVVPMVPLRGSISASGDLSPLSYIGGLMLGKPSLTAYIGVRTRPRRLVRGDEALVEAGIQSVDLQAKEGLAIVNGTAPSAAVAALALHEAHCQAALSQILTAMAVEALGGTDENFDSFFAKVRPHAGQKECARNILRFLAGSTLIRQNNGNEVFSQRQDRYSIRTASQWIGPVLEDLVLAHRQVTIELNSVTDNPLIDGERVLHGGNFQAKSITSAMEKTRQACQTIGQMLFSQCTELINPATNRGLPPNLAVDEPSESFMFKGPDILIAALQSELGFLANPVGSHVQFAEMGNQALNSLAFVSGRYTFTALDVLSQLTAAHLVAVCHALDLRALQRHFLNRLAPEFQRLTQECFASNLKADENIDSLVGVVWAGFTRYIGQATSMDSGPRFTSAVESLQATTFRYLNISSEKSAMQSLVAFEAWSRRCSDMSLEWFQATRAEYLTSPDAKPFLGEGSRCLYRYVREGLGVPFFDERYIGRAEWKVVNDTDNEGGSGPGESQYPSIGSMITAVYQAMRSGALYAVVGECFEDTMKQGKH